jgi:hypothetical protein
MPLIILLSLAAFSLATAAGFFSVVGLATTFAGSFWAVVALGSTIEFGKLVAVSFLYRFWGNVSWVMKLLLSVMVVLVMFVTSFGVFGFLTKANQMDMVVLKQSSSTLALLEAEEKQLNNRKLQIDQQIAQLKDTDVAGRVRLGKQFNTEITAINKRLPVLTVEKQKLASVQIEQQADVGPMVYLAKTLGYDVDVAVTWFTILLVLVFDPLAVILTICANIAIARRVSENTRDHNQPVVQILAEPTSQPTARLVETPLPKQTFKPLSIKYTLPKFENQPAVEPKSEVPEVDEQPLVLPSYTFTDNSHSRLEPLNVTLMQSDWTHFSNKIKSDGDLAEKIDQLKRYVDDLDSRVDTLTADEQILKERIIAFIHRKQQETKK